MKAANVEIVGMEKIGSGMVCVIVNGSRSCESGSRCLGASGTAYRELSAARKFRARMQGAEYCRTVSKEEERRWNNGKELARSSANLRRQELKF